MSGDVKALLTEEKRREAQTSFFKELRGKASVIIHDFDLFPKPEAPKDAAGVPVSADKAPASGPVSADQAPVSGDAEKK